MELQNSTKNPNLEPSNSNNGGETFFEDIDSNCSTPYVSAPSSPGRGGGPPPISSGYFYSAPASPLHFSITASSSYHHQTTTSSVPMSYEFEFSARFGSTGSAASGSMTSADELFLNGQIRPMKLSSHLERPQVLAPLLDLEEEEEDEEEGEVVVVRGRDLRLRDKSVRRRTRSMSPLRNNSHLEWTENEDDNNNKNNVACEIEDEMNNKNNENGNDCSEMENVKVDEMGLERIEITPLDSASSSRSSSAGRSSKRWVFLKDFLRSKSEGRSNNKFWSTISFSPTKDKKSSSNNQNLQAQISKEKTCETQRNGSSSSSSSSSKGSWGKKMTGKPMNGVGKRRVPPSPHELHYKANRAQAEELRRKTFLPYRQGLLGCLGFSSKGYGAMNGFARALNPVSSRVNLKSK
ncbi:probable inactive serine/threonine-protein kinase scy2 isoform X1 [Medicago truncatula]|uniref:probable inactive serine/threonine-protein kinase scy2 isoform X1 n=1 Tax=Medicago truncatula TaxID=3880 RepID=UPI001967EBFC|nr:probable inactive serine/threonine-protein kinase scy2 isoform X1 [Medicago truncatula]